MNPLRQDLQDNGYCVARGVLDQGIIGDLQRWSETIIGTVSQAHRQQNKSQGSLINLADYPEFSALIGHPGLAGLFTALQFANPVFSSGYIISKPAHSPALFWHQDWWGWDDALSYTDTLAQVFFMIYLTATTPHNGCLRVIPGSHRRWHAVHQASTAHSDALSRVDNLDDPLYQSSAEEAAVMVEPGDVVVGDARLLHGSYPNRSTAERPLLTLWYHPDFARLPAGMQARIQEIFRRRGVDTDPEGKNRRLISDWPAEQRRRIAHLLPDYQGRERPHAWNRTPQAARLQSAARNGR